MDKHQNHAQGFSGQGALMDPAYVRDATRPAGDASRAVEWARTDWALVAMALAACAGMAALTVVR